MEDTWSFRAKKFRNTPLKGDDPEKHVAYAKNGPILNGGQFGIANLPDNWEYHKLVIGFLDHKPWWLNSSSTKNRFYYCFEDDEPREVLEVDTVL